MPSAPAGSGGRPAAAEPYPVERALRWCKRYTKRRAKNFYYAFAILPERKRHAIYAAYAYSGYVDDIADELTDRDEQDRRLAATRDRLRAAHRGEAEGPLFTALAWLFREFPVDLDLFEDLTNGVEMDFTTNRYASWDDLRLYCYRVASVVGLICVSIFGTKDWERARAHAIDMGLALQVTNVMRDVREDAGRGRVYFPAEDLARAGLSAEDILACRYDDRFVRLMEDEGARARDLFRSGRRLLPLLDLRSRMCVNVMQGVYAAILDRIEDRDYDVLGSRVSVSTPAKLLLIGRLWLQAAFVRPA